MDFFRGLAYDYSLGSIPLIGVLGIATYTLLLTAALLTSLKKWVKPLRRLTVKVHRRIAITALLLATIHLLMGLSAYV